MSQPLRWGLVLASVIALLLLFQPWLFSLYPDGARTFCYQGVRTDASQPSSPNTCFTVTGGRFTRVFTPGAESKTKIRPGWVFPGLWDGHGHLLQYGEFLHSVDLFGSKGIEEIRSRLRQYLDRHPEAGSRDQWIRGIGWDQMALGGAMPTANMLESDPQFQGRFIMLDRVDVHCIWTSQAILRLLPDHLPDVPGGEIVREPGMGVFCDNAMDLVLRLWPRPDKTKKGEFLTTAMKELHKVGLVGMHDAGVPPEDMALLAEISRTEAWTLRIYAMIECAERNTFCASDVSKILEERGMLSVRSVKLFADGALGSWGSAMIEPYEDRPDVAGSLLVDAATLSNLTKQWSAAGFQVNIHAIGDLANRLALDAMEAALADLCPNEGADECQKRHRFRMEHTQIIHPHDQHRMLQLGIIPSIQPTHATSDMKYAELRLGRDRTSNEAYRMRSLRGLHPILGSDFPVEPPNPFHGIYAATTRKSPQTGLGPPGAENGWHLEEALTMDEALKGFTTGPARGAFWEREAGIIQEGSFADWIVLEDPFENITVEDLRKTRVKETWVAGNLVHSASSREDVDSLKEL